ncbi:LysE/ArgO family amino acid transporter [Agromyces sp. NBRC 114283]|uniref:LysE/ArgO family amino acid transporter n=1 Tax=Agromyces sp. NBRC 114283 TaxID=2994521 RepID=UPI0024A1045C|nr:LysE/ArgO family amino acid transporter [Agromyces sp. NBRC 114283]GLU91205.1 amino acid transporter [Agromyces sp. NBRC 114283]
MDLSSTLAGLGLGLSLIVAIGAQNVFVLRQGIRREHVFAVAAVCAMSDAVLILAGVSGIGAVLTAVPWLVDVVRWAGAAFLAGYAVLAAKRAIRPSGATLGAGASTAAPSDGTPDGAAPSAAGPAATTSAAGTLTAAPARPTHETDTAARTTLLATLGTCLALTWLNPHVYLDTVFLLGSVANGHGEGRWWFALGAALGSVLWFFGLAYGARLLGRVLSTPRAWRILDGVIAVVMLALAVSLVLPR